MRSAADAPAPWAEVWEHALYGPNGFFIRERPQDHFRTSATSSIDLAESLWTLCQRENLGEVVDYGAGGGELLVALRHVSTGALKLTGVDRAPRPQILPPQIAWQKKLPEAINGLLFAHELLDNVPCPIVEVDDHGDIREVLVNRLGEESLGGLIDSVWIDRWWPLTEPGTRAELGQTRDRLWADAVARVDGLAIAVDYGHLADARPPFGSLTSFRRGQEVDVVPDGRRDITVHVAVDSVAAAVGGSLRRQHEVLRELGLSAVRPALDRASTEPADYLAALAAASRRADLLAPGGWGDFFWIIRDARRAPLAPPVGTV